MELPNSEFRRLHEAVVKKFEDECREAKVPVPANQKSRYGFAGSREEPSIFSSMMKAPRVSKYLAGLNDRSGVEKGQTGYKQITPNYLYKRWLECDKHQKGKITLSGIYQQVYFLYLDCSDYKEFKKKFLAEPERHALHFIGYYYSFYRYEVKEFWLRLEKREDGSWWAEEWGFHDRGQKKNRRFAGPVVERRNNLVMNLNYVEKGEVKNEMKLIAGLGGDPLEEKKLMLCSMLTISTQDFPISVQAVLLPVPEAGMKAPDEQELVVRRYLMQKRLTYRVNGDNHTSLGELRVGNREVDEFAYMAGAFRVWRFGSGGVIYQSRLEITEDFRVRYYDSYYTSAHREQVCILSISTFFRRCLCLSHHPKQGTQVLGFSIIEIPGKEDFTYTHGVYCHTGLDSEYPIEARHVLVMRDENPFEAEVINKEKLQLTIDNNHELLSLYNQLSDYEPELIK